MTAASDRSGSDFDRRVESDARSGNFVERRRNALDRRHASAHSHWANDAQRARASGEQSAEDAAEDGENRLIAWQEGERRRIAVDLHDSIGSSLALVKLRLENAIKGDLADAPHSEAVEHMVAIVSDMEKTIEEVHRIAMNLRPSVLDDMGLTTTIGWFARDLKTGCPDTDVLCEIGVQEEDVPDSVKTAIFRIMQEATSNAMKHSGAKVIRIELRRDADTLRFLVEDNGKGFDVLNATSKDSSGNTLGIASMRQRAKISGGSLVVNSAPGAGTKVVVSWPMGNAPA
jgi:signal transduction histidine kinase